MLEIERKFLVNYLPDLDGVDNSDLLQGYISLSPEVRIRREDNFFYLTKKSDDLLAREENEVQIDSIAFRILESAVVGNLISKRRFRIPLDSSLVAELDIYHEQLEGLVTVEVEFSSEEESQSFAKPPWFGEEITLDKRFKNKALSQLDSISSLINQDYNLKTLVKKDV